ncbi:hypothetical protein [Brevibacillus laterosporus]|uniref:hypothetical protein n=1 Tax=Brevibacillus laterosporus TaxID=1465 RepID=UPI0018CFE001|nr:hypothetical protein [Brevibacillus laterosporus]MBG9799527.1 hypothetical protein [Brevibacillus laterosporus]MED1909752.1 hypothetical protein [Brevibacillus laterosporus]
MTIICKWPVYKDSQTIQPGQPIIGLTEEDEQRLLSLGIAYRTESTDEQAVELDKLPNLEDEKDLPDKDSQAKRKKNDVGKKSTSKKGKPNADI